MYKIDLPLKAILVANVLGIDRIYIKGIMCHKAIPGPQKKSVHLIWAAFFIAVKVFVEFEVMVLTE